MKPFRLIPGARPAFPADLQPDEEGVVALGEEIHADLIVEAYRWGHWPVSATPPIVWYSPDPRLVLFPHDLHVSHRLRRVLRCGSFEVRWNERFEALMRLCGDPARPHGWITETMIDAWRSLHERGRAHSVEVLHGAQLVGGIYGLCLGRAFFGESMVSLRSDASKVALVHLCRRMLDDGVQFLDCQMVTPHMLRMGASPLPRDLYLKLLADAPWHPDRWDANRMRGRP